MKHFTTELRQRLDDTLADLDRRSANMVQRAEQSYNAVDQSLKELKSYLSAYEFEDDQEEITFFKEIKPQFVRDQIYFMRLFYHEAHKPNGNKKLQRNHLQFSLNSIATFFDRNHFFYTYYRTHKFHNDHLYFLRGKDTVDLMPEYILDIDSSFSTIYSLKLSKILAYEKLNQYFQNELALLENNPFFDGPPKVNRELEWTDSKVALIELAYALQARGSVNSGRSDIKKVISTLEQTFNVQLGNFYRTYVDMSLRKKNRTPFLDGLRDQLNVYMDKGDL